MHGEIRKSDLLKRWQILAPIIPSSGFTAIIQRKQCSYLFLNKQLEIFQFTPVFNGIVFTQPCFIVYYVSSASFLPLSCLNGRVNKVASCRLTGANRTGLELCRNPPGPARPLGPRQMRPSRHNTIRSLATRACRF